LLSHTTGNVIKSKNGANAIPPKAAKSALKILKPSKKMVVKEDNVPRTCQGLVANSDDEVVVFGWATHYAEAMAYSAHIRRAGRLLINKLNTLDSES
jgi:hypothetical protein